MDITDRLNNADMALDACEEAAEELLRVRGILHQVLLAYESGNHVKMHAAVYRAYEYMEEAHDSDMPDMRGGRIVV